MFAHRRLLALTFYSDSFIISAGASAQVHHFPPHGFIGWRTTRVKREGRGKILRMMRQEQDDLHRRAVKVF